MKTTIAFSTAKHVSYANRISEMICQASKKRGTGIALRSPDYLAEKMASGHAVIALTGKEVVGFCYLETWSHQRYVVNSGLIVDEKFRQTGLASAIKQKAFQLSRSLYPKARIFGITTSLPVMKINSNLGYKPVTFSELTDDEAFWHGCRSCNNYDILMRNHRAMCLCTGMLYDPTIDKKQKALSKTDRWDRFKRFLKLRKIRVQRKLQSITSISLVL